MKFLSILVIGSLLFAANNEEINKKLDLLLNKLNSLEKKLDEKDKEIKTLKKELNKQKITTKKEFAIKNCKNIKIISFIVYG